MSRTPKSRALRRAERQLIDEESPTTVQRQLLASPLAQGVDELERRRYVAREDADDISSSHGDVSFVQRSEPRLTTYAVKRVRIRWPKAIDAEMAYRELRILLQLRKLADRGLCANFVRVVEWFKGSVDALDVSLSASASASSRQYMYYVLEYCDTTLDKQREQLSLRQLKSIAFQLIYALHVAQGENEFAHLDLHMKNVLLQTLDASDAIEYDVGGRVHRCDSFMVKIADFGLSRITLDDGRVIFNDRQQMGDFFDTCKRTDIEQIEAHLARIGKRAFDNDTASVLAGATSSGGGGGATDDLTIDWQNLTRLRSRIRSGDPLAVLLDDDFFDSLRLPFVKSAAVPPAAPASSSSARKSVGRKSIGAKTTTVDVLLPAQQVPQRRFSYRPRAAMPVTPAATAAALQPHTTQRRRTRSAVKEERAVATEKTANALRRSREADENADNENAAELETVRKRLSFAP